KAFDVLAFLIERRGCLVQKDELMQQVWADSFVEEANLARTVWMLRKALDADRNDHSYIETIPKLGYRFVGQVTEIFSEDALETLDSMPDDSSNGSKSGGLTDHLSQLTREIEKGSRHGVSIWRRHRLLIFAAAVILASLPASIYFWRARSFSVPEKPQIHSLAVLPLENLSGDAAQEYLTNGVTEGLIASLSRAKDLRVTAPKAAKQYK